VQLAAGPTLDSLRLSWNLLRDRHGAPLASLQPRFIAPRAEGGPYRLLAGPLPSKADADKVCADIRVGKQGLLLHPLHRRSAVASLVAIEETQPSCGLGRPRSVEIRKEIPATRVILGLVPRIHRAASSIAVGSFSFPYPRWPAFLLLPNSPPRSAGSSDLFRG
jgi:hypothetical protein